MEIVGQRNHDICIIYPKFNRRQQALDNLTVKRLKNDFDERRGVRGSNVKNFNKKVICPILQNRKTAYMG